ncbi:MAG: sulfocyanin-like copper-binding protein [Gemmatimonadota bacterium]
MSVAPGAGPAPEEPAPADTPPAAAADTGAGTAGRDTLPGEPEWMSVDEAQKTVRFDVVAGKDATNSAWNFNGYANGDMTITVPQGWTVVMTFSNRDGDVPHSVFFLEQGPPFPTVMPDRPDIPRAYSINLQNGIGAGQTDTLRFPVNDAGEYTMPCGVPGHAMAGMWDHFVVSADAQRPSVTFVS